MKGKLSYINSAHRRIIAHLFNVRTPVDVILGMTKIRLSDS